LGPCDFPGLNLYEPRHSALDSHTHQRAMDGYNSWIPNFDDNSSWRWAWWKFNMKPEDLFTTLAEQYNTVPCNIQDRTAFHHDVSELAAKAKDEDDFRRELALRRDQRLDDIRQALEDINLELVYSSATTINDHFLPAFLNFTSNHSLDSLALLFQALLRPQTPSPLPLPRLPGTAPVNQTESPHSGTAQISPTETPQANLTGATVIDTRKDVVEEGSRRDENLQGAGRRSRPPPRTRRQSSPALTRNAGVGRKRRARPPRLATEPGSDVRTAKQRKTYEKTRTSRRLAGQSPSTLPGALSVARIEGGK
jgi:hypothetical protein